MLSIYKCNINRSQSPPIPSASNGHKIQPRPPSPRTICESRNGTSIQLGNTKNFNFPILSAVAPDYNKVTNYFVTDASISGPKEVQTSPSENTFQPMPNTSVWNANIQLKLGTPSNGSARVVCESCHTDSSPEWRKGPTGQKT
jgi:hypothetical protein